MGGLLHLVQRGGDWAGPYTNHRIFCPLLCGFSVPIKGLNCYRRALFDDVVWDGPDDRRFAVHVQVTRTSWFHRRTRRRKKVAVSSWRARPRDSLTTSRTGGTATASTFSRRRRWWHELASTPTAASSSTASRETMPGGTRVGLPTALDFRQRRLPSSMSPVS